MPLKKTGKKYGVQMFGPSAVPMPKSPKGKMSDSATGSIMPKKNKVMEKMKKMQKKFNKSRY